MDINLDMTLEEKVLAAINQGKLDDCLDVVIDHAMRRKHEVALSIARDLHPDDKVRVAQRSTIKPAYIRGLYCTVVQMNKTTVTVRIDNEDPDGNSQHKGKYTSLVRLPVDMMEPV